MKLLFNRVITTKRFLSSNFNIQINARDLFFRKPPIDLEKNKKLLLEKDELSSEIGKISLQKDRLKAEILKLDNKLSSQFLKLKNCQKELDEIQFFIDSIDSLKNYKINDEDKKYIEEAIEGIFNLSLEGETGMLSLNREYPKPAIATCFRLFDITFRNELSNGYINNFLHAYFPSPENFRLNLITFSDENLSDIEKLLKFVQESLTINIDSAKQIINKDFAQLKEKLYDPFINSQIKQAFIKYKGCTAAIYKLQDLIGKTKENINLEISGAIIAAERKEFKEIMKLR